MTGFQGVVAMSGEGMLVDEHGCVILFDTVEEAKWALEHQKMTVDLEQWEFVRVVFSSKLFSSKSRLPAGLLTHRLVVRPPNTCLQRHGVVLPPKPHG